MTAPQPRITRTTRRERTMSAPRYYAGIGDHTTPLEVLLQMTIFAARLREQDYVLRTGGASGADAAFEQGAGPAAEVFIPWPGFQDRECREAEPCVMVPPDRSWATVIARKHHRGWHFLTDPARKLVARNACVILGRDQNAAPAEFVVCWTPKGKIKDDIGHALRIAISRDIPVYNLARDDDVSRLRKDRGI